MQAKSLATLTPRHTHHLPADRHGQALLIASSMVLGTIGVFVEEAGQHPLTTVWFRCLFGLLALTVWGTATGRLQDLRLRGQALGTALTAGTLMILNWALFFAAIPRTSIGVATVAFHIQPIWVMVFGAWWLRERVAPRQWAATLVALGGLTLTTGLLGNAPSARTIDQSYGLGLAMCMGGSLSYAAVTLIAKAERRISSFALAWWQCATGLILLAWAPFVLGWPQSLRAWSWLAGLGIFHTGLAYALAFAGMARLGIGKIAVLQFVYPLSAIVVDRLVYGQTLTATQWGGVALMAAALWAIGRSKPT